ncbi:unnamed protein product [Cuscuta campestris]|uniref:Uncharacterized protein n=1 Tax=Cuscuta campestris TaxID=132261 RepID=A0A484N8B8_9ASTE|nr:unnamed protein product [Cuscuta campestris]
MLPGTALSKSQSPSPPEQKELVMKNESSDVETDILSVSIILNGLLLECMSSTLSVLLSVDSQSLAAASRCPASPFPSRSPPLLPSPVAAAIIADGCSAATPNGGRRQTPDAAVSPSPESSAAVALSTAAILAVECNAAVPPSSVVRRRRLQRRQSLLTALELPLRHCRRRPSPSPHPAAAPS